MKNTTKILAVAVTLILTLTFPAIAGNSGHEGHGHGGHDSGKGIRHAHVDGHHLSYKLIDMKEKMKGMKNMPEMKDTHHLMVYVKDSDGKVVDKAKVGYLIGSPDGSDQKKMAMGMAGGFGADVNLEKKGVYKIKTKIVAGEKKLMDAFEYEVK